MHLPYVHFASVAFMVLAFIGTVHAAADAKETPSSSFDIRWGDQPAAALRTPVAPDTPTRWCGALRKGDVVSWEFNSAEPLEMTVQPQDGRNAMVVVKLDAVTEAKGMLEVGADQAYCWTWTNRTTLPVALQARLRKATR